MPEHVVFEGDKEPDTAEKSYPPTPAGKILIFRWIDGKVRPLFVSA